MTEHEQDPETEALERQLNSAFASVRPRPEFEDELWKRIRDRGGIWLRLREAWAGLSGTPLVASGAGLAALVLVALIAIVSLRAGGGGHSGMGGAAPSRSSASLPAPALKAGEGQASAVDAQVPAAIPYYGPADLSWSGSLPTLPTTAPVLSFQPPAPDAVSAFTTQAALGDPYVLSVDLTGPEPRYSIHNGSQAASGPAPSEQDAKRAADAFLADHHLQPGWPADVVVTRTPKGTVSVSYFRQFRVAGAGPGVEIDEAGNRTGISVVVGPGPEVQQVLGPLPVNAQASDYPLQSPDAIVAAALRASAATQQPVAGTVPKVALTRATLVYIAVRPGYYEPALLFTGSFAVGNQLYEKRVLVPAIDPSRLLR